jgi:hypothetical protein
MSVAAVFHAFRRFALGDLALIRGKRAADIDLFGCESTAFVASNVSTSTGASGRGVDALTALFHRAFLNLQGLNCAVLCKSRTRAQGRHRTP